MMADTSLDAGIPTAPFIDAVTNDISIPWRLFLVALQRRTGGTGPSIGISTATVQTTAIAAQATADTATEVALLADTPTDPPDTAGLALAVLLADEPAPMPDDPYLAALLVADAA